MDYVIPLSLTNCYIFVTNTSVSLQKFNSTSVNNRHQKTICVETQFFKEKQKAN